jgi:putative heme-binding domain-containing protein
VQSLSTQRRPQLVAELPALLDDQRFRVEAIRAIAAYDDEALGRRLVERYRTFTPSEKSEAILTLASRRRYGRLLTEALAKGVVPKSDVPVHVARQLLRVVGASFVDVWGPVEASAAEDASFAKYRTLLTDSAVNAGNVQSGKAVFQQTCGACHKMQGQGGVIGPDLTGSNRANLDYLLFNVLNPSGDVQDAYKMVLVTTRDGRTFAGTIVSETERQLMLRVVGQDTTAINKADILGRETTSQSMMPMGLFDAMAPKDVINLVAYLRLAR